MLALRVPVLVVSVVLAVVPMSAAQAVRRGELGPAQRAHLQSLGAAAGGLVVDVARGGHVAQKVLGPLPLSAASGTLQQRCDELIARHGVLFGATSAMEFGAP